MDKPQNIPTSPGVYLFKDTGGRIIYVGKARHLRKRVSSYFRPAEQLTAKTRAMMSHACTVDFLNTITEKEALLLEASLIKKHRPHYNINLRDDKQYVLFRIDIKAPFPRLEIVRKVRKDGTKYFGPFTSTMAARNTWKSIHSMFPLRRCSDKAMKNRIRPCLYHHIGLCLAPCTGDITVEQYAEILKRVHMFLSGKTKELMDILTKNMENAAEKLDFEKAAQIRDQRTAIEQTFEKQSTVITNGGDMDVLGVVSRGDGLSLGIIFVRGGAVIDKATFFWQNLVLEDSEELLHSFLTQFYSPDKDIPPRIVLPWILSHGKDDEAERAEIIEEILSHGKDDEAERAEIIEEITTAESQNIQIDSQETPSESYHTPMESIASILSDWRGGNVRILAARTKEDQQLVDIAKSNAKEAIHKRSDITMDQRLAAIFHGKDPIRRIECIDVSHTSGQDTKVGLVVNQDGIELKSDYRVWNLTDTNGDDYKALYQWASRRAKHGEPWPHLMLIDGGRGQVNTVEKAFKEHFQTAHHADVFLDSNEAQKNIFNENIQLPFILAGIAKARDENGHADRRAGNIADRIFLPNRSNHLPIREGAPELLFLQSIRDKAHDFALGRHRQARAKRTFNAELTRLHGIGQHTAKLLWNNYNSLENMKAASVEDLAKLPKIGKIKAQQILEALQKL